VGANPRKGFEKTPSKTLAGSTDFLVILA